MRSFLPVLFWPAFLRWKEHDDLLCSLPSHSSFSLHSIITHLTHHLIAASHSFTASLTPRAEILARLLSDQHITFTSAATHKPETSPTHDQLQPFTTTRPVATKVASNNTCAVLALSPNTVQLGQKEIRVQEAHGSHKDETGIVNGQKCYWLVLTVFPPRLSQRR